jgi:hypothetical protein
MLLLLLLVSKIATSGEINATVFGAAVMLATSTVHQIKEQFSTHQ